MTEDGRDDVVHCTRCRIATTTVSADDFVYWETLTGDEMICPGCITLGEEQAIDADALAMAAQADVDQAESGRIDDRWWSARTLEKMAELIILWLQGEIPETPWHPEPDAETHQIIEELVRLNRLGLVTDTSQPGGTGNGWAQRAMVSGRCSEGIASRVVDAGVWSDLVVFAIPPGYNSSVAVPVTRSHAGPCTIAGSVWRCREDEEFGISTELADELENAWHVEVIDPMWGRNDILWPTLLEHLRLGPLTDRSPWMTADDLGHG